jgi:hypothetical protein
VAERGREEGRPRVEKPELALNYIDKLYDELTATRAYTNRLLIGIVVASLLVIALAGGAAVGKDFSIGGSGFEIEVWALLLAGAVFVAITPGFAIGRLRYTADLSDEMESLYRQVVPELEQLRNPDVLAFEVPPLVAEASRAAGRTGVFGSSGEDAADRRFWNRALDLVGGPVTFVVVLGILPLTAQAFAASWWIRDAKSADWLIGVGASGIVVLTVLNVVVAGVAFLRQEQQRRRTVSSASSADLDR